MKFRDGSGAPAAMPDLMDVSEAEFRAFYADWVDYAWRTLRRLGVHPADLDDATQRVFVTVHRRWADRDPDRPTRPWIAGIAFKIAASERRRVRHQREWLVEPGDLDERNAAGRRADELLIERQRAGRVLTAIQALTPECRIVFVMHELDEIPCPAIARELDVPVDTVYSRLRRARERFAAAVRALRAREEGA